MKRSLILTALILAACATPTASTVLTTAQQVASGALLAYGVYSQVKGGTPVTTTQVANDLYGVANLANNYAGTGATPTSAALQNGALVSQAVAGVIAALPPKPITSSTVTTLMQAAAIVAAKPVAPVAPATPATSLRALPSRRVALTKPIRFSPESKPLIVTLP
jgi:hypothetical protein